MATSPNTRNSLLLRVRDADDHVAWTEFVSLYAPLIHAYGMRRGLQDADAADLAQNVLQSLAGALPEFRYDPAVGSFRGWLFTITRNQFLKRVKKSRRQPIATGDSAFQQRLQQEPNPLDEQAEWDREHERQIFRWAADKARPEFRDTTWNAFWSVSVEGQRPATVAEQLGISVGAVYIAKSRVTTRIREIIRSAEVA